MKTFGQKVRFTKFTKFTKSHRGIAKNSLALIIVLLVSVIGAKLVFFTHAAPAGFLYTSGTKMMLNGTQYKFVGANYAAMISGSCGFTASQAEMNAYFAKLPPRSMTRIWLIYGATSTSAIDTVVAAAAANGQYVTFTLGDQGGGCDSMVRASGFYTGGYKGAYYSWINQIVPRYKDNTTVGMWELLNEGNGSAVQFYRDSSDLIRSLDPNHLISTGAAGFDNSQNFVNIHNLPNINLVSGHEYDDGPGESYWATVCRNVGVQLNKPCYVGEYGYPATQNGSTQRVGNSACMPYTQRASWVQQKATAYANDAPIAGSMIWNADTRTFAGTDCQISFSPGDPIFAALRSVTGYPNGGTGGPADTTPPVVSLTAPANGAALTAGSIAVTATATDNLGTSGMSRVDFMLDNGTTPIKTISGGGPYSFTWDASSAGNGSHTVKAVAYDTSGNSASSRATITLSGSATQTVFNDTQLQYAGTWQTSTGEAAKYQSDDHYSSTTDSTYSLTFTGTQVKLYASKASHHGIAAVKIDNGAETNVDFYAPDPRQDQALSYTSPTLASGSHTITVRATGTKNAASAGTTINADRIDISDTPPPVDTTAPTVSLTAPAAGTSVTVGSSVGITATAADNVAVTKVEFYAGTTLISTDTTSPYAAAWTASATAGTYSLTAKAYDAAGNTKTSTAVSITVTAIQNGNGDANNDTRVNALDLSILISHDGQNYPAADFNHDGTVGAADMAILLAKWTW